MNAQDTPYVIDVHNLNKHFGDKHVVNDVSLQVARGEIFGFRPERQRQDDLDPPDVRTAHARLRQRHPSRL